MSPAGKRFPRIYRSKGASEYRNVAAREVEPKSVEVEVEVGAGEQTQVEVEVRDDELIQVKDEDEVEVGAQAQLKVEVEVMGEGKAGERTHYEVEVEVEVSSEVESGQPGVGAGERTQLNVEMDDVDEGEVAEKVQLKVEVNVVDGREAGEQTREEGVRAGERTQVDGEVEADGSSCSGSVVVAEEMQLKVEVNVVDEGEVAEKVQEEGVRAGERTQVDGEVEADGSSCSGSVAVAEKFSGGWLEDSIVIDIGVDATYWGDELDADAVEKQIADGVVADSLESGTGSGFEGSMFGFISGVDKFDLTGWDCDFDADAVGSFIATDLDAAGLSLLVGGGSGDFVVEGDSEDLLFVGGSEWTVRLDPLIVAERQLIKAECEVGCEELIGSRDGDSSYDSLISDGTEDFVGFAYGNKKMIADDDCPEVAQIDDGLEMESSRVVMEICRVIGFGISDDFGRFVSNLLYDPGGGVWLCCATRDVKSDNMVTGEDNVIEEECEEILGGFGMSGYMYVSRFVSGDDSARFEKCRMIWNLLVSHAGGYWYSVFSAFVSLAVLCCCCHERPLVVQDSSS